MTTITLEWEPDGAPRRICGRQPLRATIDPHLEATLRPHTGAFGPYFELTIQSGTLTLHQQCCCSEEGKAIAQAWMEVLPIWNQRVTELAEASRAARAEAAPAP